MTHDELLIKIYTIHNNSSDPGIDRTKQYDGMLSFMKPLLAAVELHKPVMQWSGGYDGEDNPLYAEQCSDCSSNGFTQEYPCETIQAIEKELK
jgi:hypothetical protein